MNHWEKKLAWHDKYVLNYIMYYRLACYGYPCKRINIVDVFLVPLLILLPLRFERRFLSFGYIGDHLMRLKIKILVVNIIWYFFRVALFFKYYLRTAAGKKFLQQFFKAE